MFREGEGAQRPGQGGPDKLLTKQLTQHRIKAVGKGPGINRTHPLPMIEQLAEK